MPVMKAVALLALVPALVAQAINPSPRELLNGARPLTSIETATVLNASREALTAKTFRLSSLAGGHGPEVLMGRDGQPKIIRTASGIEGGIVGGVVPGSSPSPIETQHWHEDIINLTDYTGRPVRHCDGSVEPGEMVIEYTLRSSTPAWTATARRRDAHDVEGQPALEMLRGAGPVTRGERRQIRNRWARAFVSPWAPPADRRSQPPRLTGDPMPNVVGEAPSNDAIQSLWIDTESLLPLRWDVSKRGMVTYGFDFTYESIDLRRPAGIEAPDCIR